MDTRKAATEYRLLQWSEMMVRRTQSGQSVKDFCLSAGISRNTYFYWQRKLRESACRELSAQEPAAGKALVPTGWARLEAAAAKQTIKVEVNGCSIKVSTDTDLALLAQVCQMLKTI